MKSVLQSRHGKPDPGRRQDVLHPSEMCKKDWCTRGTYLRLSGASPAPGSFSFTLQNIFAEGNFIHEKWQAWLARSGKLWGDWYCRRCMATVRRTAEPGKDPELFCLGSDYRHKWEYREVTLWDDELNIHGHEDGALTDPSCLVEFKSVGMGTLRFENPELLEKHYVRELKQYDLDGLWKSIARPFASHVRQVNIYMWLAQRMGYPYDRTQVVYEYKINQQVKEFTVPFSQDIVEPMLEGARKIKAALAAGITPGCPNDPGKGCKECRPYEETARGDADERGTADPGPGARNGAPVRAVRRGGQRDVRGRRAENGKTPDRDGPDPQAVGEITP